VISFDVSNMNVSLFLGYWKQQQNWKETLQSSESQGADHMFLPEAKESTSTAKTEKRRRYSKDLTK